MKTKPFLTFENQSDQFRQVIHLFNEMKVFFNRIGKILMGIRVQFFHQQNDVHGFQWMNIYQVSKFSVMNNKDVWSRKTRKNSSDNWLARNIEAKFVCKPLMVYCHECIHQLARETITVHKKGVHVHNQIYSFSGILCYLHSVENNYENANMHLLLCFFFLKFPPFVRRYTASSFTFCVGNTRNSCLCLSKMLLFQWKEKPWI